MTNDRRVNPDSNPDPITGAPGAHPLGVGLGAVAAGIAAGAASIAKVLFFIFLVLFIGALLLGSSLFAKK